MPSAQNPMSLVPDDEPEDEQNAPPAAEAGAQFEIPGWDGRAFAAPPNWEVRETLRMIQMRRDAREAQERMRQRMRALAREEARIAQRIRQREATDSEHSDWSGWTGDNESTYHGDRGDARRHAAKSKK